MIYICHIEYTAKVISIIKTPVIEAFKVLSVKGVFFLFTFCQKVALDVSSDLSEIHIYTNWFNSFKPEKILNIFNWRF